MFWEHHLFMRASERGMMFLMLNYNPAENGPFHNSDYLLKSWFSGPAFRCETSRFLIIARFWTLVIFLRQAPRKHFFCFVFPLFMLLLSHIKIEALVVSETRTITLHIKGLFYQPLRKTPSLCLKDRVTEGIRHASCFMAMLSIVILWETKEEKI